MGQKWFHNVFLQQMILDHLGCTNKWNEPFFEPIASQFGHSTVTKCVENGLFWDQKWVKNGSTMCFSKDTFGPFGVHKQVE